MRSYKWFSVVLVILFSCGKSLPVLEGIDQKVWKEDRNGCNGKRAPMKEQLIQEKRKLLALKERQVIELLGRPDQNELYQRNQKFYTYFIEPALTCKGDSSSNPKKLVVRFNAMGLAKEVVVE